MSNPPFVIRGPNRLEIRDFVRNEKFFSLYIQALRVSLFLNHNRGHTE